MTDFRVDDRVYLTPKTLGAPTVCWTQPQAVIVANPQGPMVTVLVDGEATQREIHINNLVRNLPNPQRRIPVLPAGPALVLPEGMKEVPLW